MRDDVFAPAWRAALYGGLFFGGILAVLLLLAGIPFAAAWPFVFVSTGAMAGVFGFVVLYLQLQQYNRLRDTAIVEHEVEEPEEQLEPTLAFSQSHRVGDVGLKTKLRNPPEPKPGALKAYCEFMVDNNWAGLSESGAKVFGFTRPWWLQLRQFLFSQGYAGPRDPDTPQQGIELTEAGRAWAEDLAGAPPQAVTARPFKASRTNDE